MTNEEQPVAATSRSLLKPANQKPTICYCKSGECSAPKPEWCVGRRYADGFRDADAEPVAWWPQVRPEVAAFALLMERELRNNDHKPGWKEDAPDSLARRVVEEAAELLTVATSYEAAALSPVPRKTREQIAEEAADVANMAMMVADVCGALSPYTAPPRPDAYAEPVAWRWRYKGAWPWTFIDDRFSVQRLSSHNEIEVEPLYTAPPRPDYELSAIAAAIGSNRFMDPPDGRDVSLAEQVCRMREALERAEATLVQSNAEPVAWEYKTADGWQRISLKNYKILKGSSFELRPIFDAKAGRRPTRSRT